MTLHRLSRASARVLLLAACVAGCASHVEPQRLQFEFHSSRLMNLHHRLYALARHPDDIGAPPWDGVGMAPTCIMRRDASEKSQQEHARSPVQMQANAAIAYYAEHFAKRDLLFDDEMRDIKHALARAADDQSDAHGLGLPPALADVLSLPFAGDGPTGCAWIWREAGSNLAGTDARNRAWIARVEALNARYGAEIQPAIERALGARFPARIRDDVVVDTGTRTGAYTDEPPPQTVIPSGRASYDGDAALEMIWHEAAHAGVTDALEKAIADEVKAQHRQPADDLWHAVQFYTVGYATQQAFKRHGVDYVPYATKNHVFEHGWAAYLPIIESEWRPWLDGRGTLQEAVKAMVAKLPPAA